jgi:uncharacterized protein with HEPN domain
MKRDIIIFINDILECIENIENFTQGFSKVDFFDDKKTQDAVIRNLEIIGEAIKNIPDKFRRKYPKIEWKKIAGVRDIFIHSYFGVDLEIVWTIVKKDIPVLKNNIKFILKDKR